MRKRNKKEKRGKNKYKNKKERKYKNTEKKSRAVITATNIKRQRTIKIKVDANAHEN
jgi:hypothetical protein